MCSAVDTYRHIKRGGGRGTILATLKKQKRERGGNLYFNFFGVAASKW